jgi:Glycosyltransferase family 87
MVASTENLPSERSAWAAALVAVVVFAGTWALLHTDFYRQQILDTPVYQRYGNAIADGKVPYRDFELEYPPGALPMFALPGLAEPGHDQDVTPGFRRTFEALMWFCGAVVLCAVAIVLHALRRPPAVMWAVLLFVALAPLLLGSLVLSRFDLWPVALVVGSLAALVSGRLRLGHGLLGAAITAKLYPAVLLPLAVAFAWKRVGRREAVVCAGIAVAVVAVVLLPFVVLAPGGVWHSVSVQLDRPLQVESLGSALLLAAHHVFGVGVTGETSHGSQNLDGGAADALAVVTTVLEVAVLAAIWIAFARGSGSRESLVRAAAAVLCAFVAFGKVLSPQFLLWLIPVVPLVRGRRGLWASALLAVALVLTQVWFPSRYFRYALDFEAGLTWVVLARDLVLVALAAVLALPLWAAASQAKPSGAVRNGPVRRGRVGGLSPDEARRDTAPPS